jgi:hypothetical protein
VTAPSSRCSTRCGHTGGAWGMAGQRLRLQPCTRYMPKGVQAKYQERKAFTSSSSLCERSLLPTGRPVDEGRSGANRRCRGRRFRHRGYGSDEGSCDRGHKLLAFVQ